MAKKRIINVPRNGSNADFIPENFMLIDGAEGSAKMPMNLFGKASSITELATGKADVSDVLTTWEPYGAAAVTGKLAFHSTANPTRTEIVLKDATRPGGSIAEDVVVGYTVPDITSGSVGKYLMVDDQQGIGWQPLSHTLSYPSTIGDVGTYDTIKGTIAFQTDNTPRRTSAYLTFDSGNPRCLGMFVPPVSREDAGKILTVDENDGAVWIDIERWKILLNSTTDAGGDENHCAYITVDSNGNATFGRAKRLFWEWTFSNPTVTVTSDDIGNRYLDFEFPLGETGMEIFHNGNLITMKGSNLQMGNILNDKRLSFLLRGVGGTPTFLLDTGFETYTETIVSNYEWKAFKSFGLTGSNNYASLNAILRVPFDYNNFAVGDVITINGNIIISMFGVAGND